MRRPFARPKRRLPVAVFALLVLAAPAAGHAECSLTFLPMEESKYLLKGEGCEGIAGVNFTVDYDSTDLFSPRVDVMGGTLLEGHEEASSPGSLQVRIRREDPGARYFEACVYFQKREDYPALVNLVTAEIADLSGVLKPVPVDMVPPVPGMNEPDPVEAAPVPSPSPSPSAVAERKPVPPVTAEPEEKAVFERFRDFAGERSLAAFTALFSSAAPCCSQTPPVVISDGRQSARVIISGPEAGDGPPPLAVSGGRLIAVERGLKNDWTLVVQPHEKWWDVRVSWAAGEVTIEFPLTVAPPIQIPPDQLAGLDEKSFTPRLRSFLEESGKENPRVAVWFREYLFTANYLAAQEGRKGEREGM